MAHAINGTSLRQLEYALQYSQESFLGLWNEKLNSLQKTLLYVMDEAGIISSAVHFAL
jgi:hypothetical protein